MPSLADMDLTAFALPRFSPLVMSAMMMEAPVTHMETPIPPMNSSTRNSQKPGAKNWARVVSPLRRCQP